MSDAWMENVVNPTNAIERENDDRRLVLSRYSAPTGCARD
jgi:hypothetical protein